MASGLRTGGFTALLLVFAVVLAAAAVPMLSAHSPLEAAGPDSDPASDSVDAADDPDLDSLEDGETGEGLIHEDFASLADGDLGETMTGAAGLLALLFGADGVGGAVGEPTDEQDSEPEEDDRAHDGTDGDELDREDEDEGDDDAVDDDEETGDEGSDEDDGAEDDDDVESVDDDSTESDETAGESDDSDQEHAGESDESDDELAGAEDGSDDSDEASEDDTDDRSEDDEAAGSDADAGGEASDSLLDRFDPVTIGLLVGGLIALVVGWIAYRTGRGLVGIMLSIPTLIVGAITRFVFGVTAVVERVIGAVRSASSVLALPGLFVAAVVQSGRDLAAAVGSLFDRGEPTVDAGDVEQLPSEREQIRAAWRAVVDAVGSRRFRRRTPGEIKQRALDRGLPEQPVSTLADVFRDVEYGDKDPTERASSAVSAATELSDAADSGDQQTNESTGSAEGRQ